MTGLEYAQCLHGARGLGGGTILSVTRCLNTDSGDQANILINQSPRGPSTIVGTERRPAADPSLISVASKTSLMSFALGETPQWMSPELLDPDRFGITNCRPTKQSNGYALEMVVYEVRTDAIVPTTF